MEANDHQRPEMMRRKMRRRTDKRKKIELKGGKHNRTAL
jgi:hypothetical protein